MADLDRRRIPIQYFNNVWWMIGLVETGVTGLPFFTPWPARGFGGCAFTYMGCPVYRTRKAAREALAMLKRTNPSRFFRNAKPWRVTITVQPWL